MKKIVKKCAVFCTAFLGTAVAGSVFAFASSEPTFGEKMATAGRNTVLGLIVVFVVLLLLSFIISCFKFIGPKKNKKTPVKKVEGTDFVNKKAAARPAAEDEELAAVIIAAICAAEGTDYVPGQYRLKSIKPVRAMKKWNRVR